MLYSKRPHDLSVKEKWQMKHLLNRHYESFKRDLTQQNERVGDELAGGKCLVGIPNPPFLYSFSKAKHVLWKA